MVRKFLERAAIVDTIKNEHRTNAKRKRRGLTHHPIRAYSCGCSAPNCGAFHVIDKGSTIPTAAECVALLAADNQTRGATGKRKKRTFNSQSQFYLRQVRDRLPLGSPTPADVV